ncbi:tetratricopeptide repeat protein [Robiginitalea aurantiaca]|uniref:Tetratricopeptide repeat protein n=1 Tax=Robiginitalea aurantiaca TaxID=3056915 RepID=A0ABT7WED3_9FLAO|nr:tetratricopeptide repeat protein [Robiginitalea aurantiaca]MDM9631238.1 tetratricopeptide repeat protein [Robiginitalea aurantiaca]
MKLTHSLINPVFALLMLGNLGMAQSEDLFDKATASYNQGNYEEAIGFYEQILSNGEHSAALYFNMGNAHYKQNEVAPSIYYYEKALLLKPGDTEILNNLAYARNMTLDDISPLPEPDLERLYKGILNSFSMNTWAFLGIFLMFLFVGMYLFFLGSDRPNRKRIGLISSGIALMLALFCTAFSYLRYRAYQESQPAIIFNREITVRSEPNRDSSPVFLLHEGTKVQVKDSLDVWLKIELADGQTGWAEGDALRLLKDF